MSSPASLFGILLDTRERLEAFVTAASKREGNEDFSVLEEEQLRRARRALRQINNEHLPWSRMERIDAARAATIEIWLLRAWDEFPLNEYPGRGNPNG